MKSPPISRRPEAPQGREDPERAVDRRVPGGIEGAAALVQRGDLAAHDRVCAVRPQIAEVVEVPARDDAAAGGRDRLHVAVGLGLPQPSAAVRRVRGHHAPLAGDGGEHRSVLLRQVEDGGRGAGVPRGRRPGDGVDRGQVPRVGAGGVRERPAEHDLRGGGDDGADAPVRPGIPGGEGAAGRVEGGGVAAGRAVGAREHATCVDAASGHGERVHLLVRVRRERRERPARRDERQMPRPPAVDRGERTTGQDPGSIGGEGLHRMVRVRRPACDEVPRRVERGEVRDGRRVPGVVRHAAELPADVGDAAQVEDAR